MAKLFFALPAEALAPDLVAWRDQLPWPGQPVPAANLHLTLAFLGEADQLTTTRLMAAVERQHCPPLTIALNETGWFGSARPPGSARRSGPTSSPCWPGRCVATARSWGLAAASRAIAPSPCRAGRANRRPCPPPISCCRPTASASINPSRPRTGCATSPRLLAAAGQRKWHPDRRPCPDSSIKRAIP